MSGQAHNISTETWSDLIARKLPSLRFGTIQLTVHDGRIVQIECTERVRLDSPPNTKGGEPAVARQQ